MTKKKEQILDEYRFTKGELLKSSRYSNQRDVLNAVLDNDKRYLFTEVDKLIEKFMKGEVK